MCGAVTVRGVTEPCTALYGAVRFPIYLRYACSSAQCTSRQARRQGALSYSGIQVRIDGPDTNGLSPRTQGGVSCVTKRSARRTVLSVQSRSTESGYNVLSLFSEKVSWALPLYLDSPGDDRRRRGQGQQDNKPPNVGQPPGSQASR